MLESNYANSDWSIHDLFDAGMEEAQIHDMVSTIAQQRKRQGRGANGHHADPPIYAPDDVPDGLVTLREAAETYGVKVGRLRNWAQRGHLTPRARMQSPGAPAILIRPGDVEEIIANPPKAGRPSKILI